MKYELRFQTHPLYGRIPLNERIVQDQQGRSYPVQYDLDFLPKLPSGAVRGEPRKQNLCFACHTPKYFYVDEKRACIQCGEQFTFKAAEQKFWYESLGFYGTSIAIRCLDCRRKKRSDKAIQAQMQAAKSAVKADPADGAGWLALAEAVVRYRQRTGHGDLEDAIAASRRARKLAPQLAEPLFWEALSHLFFKRLEKTRSLLELFVSLPARSKRDHDLKREGTQLLLELNSPIRAA